MRAGLTRGCGCGRAPPTARSGWCGVRGGNRLACRGLDGLPVRSDVDGRAGGVPPPGVRNVVTFNRPLLDAELISLLRRARGEVVLEHGSDAADWRTQDAVDWNGGRLAVPHAT
ncbi:unnamed protein product, partial [Prorocentrum cordatum]